MKEFKIEIKKGQEFSRLEMMKKISDKIITEDLFERKICVESNPFFGVKKSVAKKDLKIKIQIL